jgi:subtilisin
MSEKNEQTTTAQASQSTGRSTQTSGSSAAGAGRAAHAGLTPPGKILASKQKLFIIAPRRLGGIMYPIGLQPMALDYVEQALRSSPDVEIVDRIGPKGLVGTLADGMGGVPHIIVAKMADDKADILRQQSAGQLIVETNQPLRLDLSEAHEPGLVTAAVATSTPAVSVAVMVLGRDNTPVRDAEVHLFGTLMPARAVTDERGMATLSLFGDDSLNPRSTPLKPTSCFCGRCRNRFRVSRGSRLWAGGKERCGWTSSPGPTAVRERASRL